jgi:hypothetical protein
VTRSWPELGQVHARLGELVQDLPGVEVEDSHGHRSYTLRGKRIAWLLVDHDAGPHGAGCDRAGG